MQDKRMEKLVTAKVLERGHGEEECYVIASRLSAKYRCYTEVADNEVKGWASRVGENKIRFLDFREMHFVLNYLGIMEEHDEIDKPQHYTFTRPAKDVWDVLQQAELLEDHLVASAFQYLARCKKKGMYRKDLLKAASYIKKALELHDEESTKGH